MQNAYVQDKILHDKIVEVLMINTKLYLKIYYINTYHVIYF